MHKRIWKSAGLQDVFHRRQPGLLKGYMRPAPCVMLRACSTKYGL